MSDQKEMALPKLYTDDEAAEYFGMSKVTLWRERSRGQINFRRCAGRLIYTQQDLEQYLERCSNGPAQTKRQITR
jgi:hypothetical protein